jgi:hypothetical protein
MLSRRIPWVNFPFRDNPRPENRTLSVQKAVLESVGPATVDQIIPIFSGSIAIGATQTGRTVVSTKYSGFILGFQFLSYVTDPFDIDSSGLFFSWSLTDFPFRDIKRGLGSTTSGNPGARYLPQEIPFRQYDVLEWEITNNSPSAIVMNFQLPILEVRR